MKITLNGKIFEVNIIRAYKGSVQFEVNGKSYLVERPKSASKLENDSNIKVTERSNISSNKTSGNEIIAPISGIILSISISIGEKVKQGDEICILEAMKMQNKILANTDGTIEKLYCKEGEEISEGNLIASISSDKA